MANKKTLKGYFETGDIPNQSQYHELINSNLNLNETGTQILVGTLSSSFLEVENHITSSGNISSSGIITAEHILSSDDIVAQGIISASGALHGDSITLGGNIYIKSVGFVEVGGVSQILFQSTQTYFQNDIKLPDNKKLVLGTNSNYKIGADSIDRLLITSGSSTSQTTLITYSPSNKTLNFNGDAITTDGYLKATNITASGNISASGTIYADNFQSTGGDVAGINFTDNLLITGDITASGNISASGIINSQQLRLGTRIYADFSGTEFRVGVGAPSQHITDFKVSDGSGNGNSVFLDASSGHITASGNISASNLNVNKVTIEADPDNSYLTQLDMTSISDSIINMYMDGNLNTSFHSRGNIDSFVEAGTSVANFGVGTITPAEKLTVHGNISGSGNLKIDGSQVDFTNLPTSDPSVAGRLYRDGTDLKISLG